jgi:hypothetical protein
MKITRSQLRRIIKEELEGLEDVDSGMMRRVNMASQIRNKLASYSEILKPHRDAVDAIKVSLRRDELAKKLKELNDAYDSGELSPDPNSPNESPDATVKRAYDEHVAQVRRDIAGARDKLRKAEASLDPSPESLRKRLSYLTLD